MPASLKDLRTRIKSVRNTEQITKAMKLVSTAKFGKAQSQVVQARPYARALTRIVRDVVACLSDKAEHPLLTKSDSKVTSLVVISSERGLCGSFNSNVSKLAMRTVAELKEQGREVAITCFGKKAHQVLVRYLRDQGFVGAHCQLADIENKPSLLAEAGVIRLVTTGFDKRVQTFAEIMSKAFESVYCDKGFGELQILFSRFESAGNLPLTKETLLPIATPKTDGVVLQEPLFEPAPQELLSTLLPQYLAMGLQQILMESIASEHCARMAAMDSATRNAREMMKKLETTYQRARQASITKELIEIISGAEAL